MPRRFFRKFNVKRDRVHGQWYMAPFRHLLHDHRLWTVRRRNVVPAFALGVFIAFLPMPGHMLSAALLALAFRVHIPVAVLTTLISNPLTMGPLYYLCYKFGQILLRLEPVPFNFELSFAWLGGQFLVIWQPLVLGCLLLGSMAASVAYIGLDIFWRASIADYLAKRRAKKAARDRGEF